MRTHGVNVPTLVVIAAAALLGVACGDVPELATPPDLAEPVAPDGAVAIDVSMPPPPTCLAPLGSSLVVDVKTTGAKGDGLTDDTLAIQAAIDQVGGTGGTVLVPDGTYMIDATRAGGAGLDLEADMTIRLSSGAVLKVIPNALGGYRLLRIGAPNVAVVGGTLEGDRAAHLGTTGEHGMGITISGASSVVIEGVTIKEFWGDAIYVTSGARRVSVCDVVTDHNRRQGISIIDVDGMRVTRSTFKNTIGTPPAAGIDFEPNEGNRVNDVVVSGCVTENNGGDGFQIGVPGKHTGTAFITAVVIDGNIVRGNGKDASNIATASSYGIEISNTHNHRILNNVIENNTGDGILLRGGASGNTITANTVTGNSKRGINDPLGMNILSGNMLSGNGIAP